ncbi:TonB-dependent receptor [Phaeobacter sp. B1627]|uniref:TonB-dependent receptor n=1 Tax=Phaeobacter sp. B1627 TaxID=2583809 RepID=UPI00159ED813|nr:TonB-dependent receptor [Phaeobacter sp. B1627]
MSLYLSTSLLAFALASHSYAQDADLFELAPIFVDGKLISEPWYKSGTSFEVLDEDTLQKRPAQETVHDVLEKAANVSALEATAKAPTIRGIDGTGPAEGANAFFAGSRARLGLTIDGRPAGYNEIVFGNQSLWDVEKVEILKGPQSTLSGRNAIAGTVAITTNAPVFENEGKVEVSGGNHDQKRISGMYNMAVSDNLAFRFAADISESQSTVQYTPFEGADNPGHRSTRMFRGEMLSNLDIADGATLRIIAEHNSHYGPNAERVNRPYEARMSQFPQQPRHEVSTNSLGADFDVDLNASVRFELDASITDFRFDRTAVPNSSNAWIDTQEVSIDPRLRFFGAGGIEALVGLHYYHADQDEFIEFVEDQNFSDTTETTAIYGEIKLPLAADFELSLGARYEQERHKRSGGDADGSIAEVNTNRTFEAFLPRLGLNWQPVDGQSYGFHVSKGYNAGGGGIAIGAPNPFPIVHYEYDTETAANFEVYGRQELLGGDLQLTQNLFFTKYKNMQLPFDLTPGDTLDELFVVRNADEVISYGAEFSAAYQMSDAFGLYGGIGLLKTEIKRFPGSGVEGNELFNAPKATATLGANWSNHGWSLNVAARYTSSYYTGINNRARGKTASSVVADASVSYDFDKVRFFAEVKNLFDNQDAIAIYPGATASADSAVLRQPRALRIGLSRSF